jgi:hypothetical protein
MAHRFAALQYPEAFDTFVKSSGDQVLSDPINVR